MQLIGQAIRHETFGKGIVTGWNRNILTVCFPGGDKRFLYPYAFARLHLTLRNQEMQAEIQENKDADAPVVPSYNNFKEELEELNRIHGQAYDFLFTFNEPEVNGTNIRRSVTVNCSAEDYDAAVEMMREILQGPYRSLIYNISMDSVSAVDADFEPNIKEGRVELTFNMNYFETTEGAESLEGLQVEETQAASGGGLANSDMSNLQRSDLETAAEAAFGE